MWRLVVRPVARFLLTTVFAFLFALLIVWGRQAPWYP
jgi:hypothetical protein